MNKYKLFIAVFCLIFLVGSVSALSLNSKNFDKNVGKYGKYEIKNIFGSKLKDVQLTENTEVCNYDECYAIMDLTLYKKGNLIDDVIFYKDVNEEWIETNIRDYQFYYLDNKNEWSPLNITEEFNEGNYKIKLVGHKKPSWKIDWQVKTSGIWTKEWAVWGNISLGDDAEVILNSPTDDSIVYSNLVNFNSTANVTDGSYITNMSLWTNETGSWEIRNESQIEIQNISSPLGTSLSSSIMPYNTFRGVCFEVNDTYNLSYANIPYYLASGSYGQPIGRLYRNGSQVIENTAIFNNKFNFNKYEINSSYEYCIEFLCGDADGCTLGKKDTSVSYPYVSSSGFLNYTRGYENGYTTSFIWGADDVYVERYMEESTQTWNRTITDDIIWNVQACDSDGDCGFAPSNYSLSLDTTTPTVNLLYPTGTINYGTNGTSTNLNYSIIDSNLDKCWYDYNGVNTTISNCSLNTTFTQLRGLNSITLWANDTVGNTASSVGSWDYLLYLNSESYVSSIIEGSSSTFILNATTNGTDIAIANLIYDGTPYTSSWTKDGDIFYISKDITVPFVPTPTNFTWYWNITQGGTMQSLTQRNQTVSAFGVDNCSANTNVLYNFTIVDEKTQAELNETGDNTLVKLDLRIYSNLDSSEVINYTTSFNKTNPFAICLDNNLSGGESFKLDLELQYGADGYATEFYNIQKTTIDNSSLNQNITLYNLDNIPSQVFKINYRDASYLPVEDALISVQRKYIDEGVFKVVEAPVTDSDGNTLAHLEEEDAIYTFIVTKNGETLGTFIKQRVKCQNPVLLTCDINFNSFSSAVEPEKYIGVNGMNYVLSYDTSTKLVSSIFTIDDGTAETVSLNVTLLNGTSKDLCSNQLTSNSGTVSCVIPSSYTTGTALVKIYKNGEYSGQATFNLGDVNSKDRFGGNLLFLSLFMYLTLFGVGISDNPLITGIFLFLGATLGILMNITTSTGFIGASATILWLLIAIILVLTKGANRG